MFPVLKLWSAKEVNETSVVLRRQWKEFVPAAAEVQAAALRDVVTSTLSELVHEFNIAFDKVKSDEEEREMMSRAYAMFSKWFSQLFVPTATGDASEYVLMRRRVYHKLTRPEFTEVDDEKIMVPYAPGSGAMACILVCYADDSDRIDTERLCDLLTY